MREGESDWNAHPAGTLSSPCAHPNRPLGALPRRRERPVRRRPRIHHGLLRYQCELRCWVNLGRPLVLVLALALVARGRG